ncbi:MAG TPA: hypothetical protein VFW07_13755 [Parafilimonas sp.]|nr:hypothetical protein [Parafilimonas sp.]
MNNIAKLIAEKTGYANLLDDLNKLSGSELNSLLLELFRKRIKKISPAALLNDFDKNRFSAPSSVETISFKQFELRYLELAVAKKFNVVTLSPLTSLGACSVMGYVDQNNVVSALRGTEVISDATNVFALMIANEFKKRRMNEVIKYATTQRHVRSQALHNPAFTTHFGVFCMASGGLDKGNFSFELQHLPEHMQIHQSLLSNEFDKEKLFIKIFLKDDNKIFYQKLQGLLKDFTNVKIEKETNEGSYYTLAQFKFFLNHEGKEINLSDGGFVDRTQKLIPNKKHRLIISGIGTELIHKIKQA